jgi:hypothetical protein
MEKIMSPSINISPDILGLFNQQESPVPTSVATDLESLCSVLDVLQTNGQTDHSSLAGCLSRISGWLKTQQEANTDDKSGWTSKPFGVKGMGGMITFRNDQWEIIFNLNGHNQSYMGFWQSRASDKPDHNGSFRIQTSDGGMQLLIEGIQSLQIFLPELQPDTWGTMDTFFQRLNNSQPPKTPTEASSPSQEQRKSAPPKPTSRPDVDFSSNDAPTILARPTKQKNATVKSPLETPEAEISTDSAPTILAKSTRQKNTFVIPPTVTSDKRPLPTKQPTQTQSDVWQCICGNQNAGQVCLKCGKEKPSPATVQKSAPAQPTVCRQCGGVLSIGARFCRKCGTKVLV